MEPPPILAALRPGAQAAFEPAAALAGVRLACVPGFAEAREWLRTWPAPAAVVVDLDLPRVEGEGLALVAECARRVPVLVAGGSPDDRRAALGAGGRDFVARPYDLEALADRLALLALRPAPPVAALRELAAAFAHEVLNPLAAGLGMIEIALVGGGVSPGARPLLEEALAAGRRAAAIVRAVEAAAARPGGAAAGLPPGLARAVLGRPA
jgi:signal transduction histidine kinase